MLATVLLCIGGVLDDMIKRLAIFYEEQVQIQSRIKAALTYPVLLIFICIAVVIFLITFVLPQFVNVFTDLGTTIPLPTKILLFISNGIVSYWYLVAAILVASITSFVLYIRTAPGRLWFDKSKLKIPVIGTLIRKILISRFAQTLYILVNSGIPLLTALDVVKDTLNNIVLENSLKKVASSVSEGKSIAQELAQNKVFPEMVVNMIKAGEVTGALDKMLKKVSDFYDREINNTINAITSLIEPLLIILIAFVIGLISIAIFLPMVELMNKLHA